MENISKLTPILYEKTETKFKHNGLGKLSKLLVYEIEEVLNGEFEALFEYPTNGRLAEHIENEVFIKAKPNQKDDPHVFKVYDYELDTFKQTYLIYARSKNIEDLRNNLILDVEVNSLNPMQAYNLAKDHAVGPVSTRFYSDITTASSVHWERRNMLSIIAGERGSMIQYWGGEIKHEIGLINLYRRRGEDNVATVRHNKNLDGLKATYSTKGLVTAIIPYFKKNESESVYGDVVKSQHINKYPNIYYDLVEYSDDDLGLVKENESEDEYSDSVIVEALNNKANNWFEENTGKDLIAINMEIALKDISQTKEYEKFKHFEQIGIGDTITVYTKRYNININAKVRKVLYNGLTDKNEVVEVGTVRRTLYDDVRDAVDRELNLANSKLQEGIDSAISNANGKNTNYYGTADPNEVGLKGQEDDLYFRTNGQKKELWVYKNGMWHLEIGDMTGEEIKHELEEAKKQVQDAREKALQGIEDAKNAQSSANSAYRAANTAQQIAGSKITTFRGPDEPVANREGDLWYKEVAGDEVIVHRWTGTRWRPVIGAGVNADTEEALADAEARVEEAEAKAKENRKRADSILSGLGIAYIEDVHQGIVDGVDLAVSQRFVGIEDNPKEAIDGYHLLTERIDLYSRVLGKSEGEIGGSISRVVQSPEIIDSIVARVSTGNNLYPDGVRQDLLGWDVLGLVLEEPLIDEYAYIVRVSTSSDLAALESLRFWDNVSNGLPSEIKVSTGEGAYNYFEIHFNSISTYGHELNIYKNVEVDLYDFKVESVRRFEPDLANVQSQVTQLADSYFAGIKGPDGIMSELNLTSDGVRLMGRNITLDGDVYVRGDFKVTGKMLAEEAVIKNLSGKTLDFDTVIAKNLNADSIVGGSLYLDRGIEIKNGAVDVLSIRNGNARMNVDNLFISGQSIDSKIDSKAEGVFWVNAERVGLASKDNLGRVTSIIQTQADGTAYIGGKNVLIDGDTIVEGDFKVTGDMLAKSATIQNLKGQTLNFAEMNAIFFNADSISTGTLRGIRAEIGKGLIGGWSLESGGLYKSTPYGYTTLKPGGDVAIGIASPNHGHTTGASLQIWHDGTIRFEGGKGLISSQHDSDSLQVRALKNLDLEAGSEITLRGDVRPRDTARDTNLGTYERPWYNIIGDSLRVGSIGVMQQGSGSDDASNSVEVYSGGSLLLKTGNRNIYGQGSIYPYYRSNSYYLGSSGYRWQGIYIASGGYDEGSDARYKDNIRDIPAELISAFAEFVQPRMYDIGGKIHTGYIAQDVERALFKYVVESKMFGSVGKAREYVDSFQLLNRGESYLSLVYNQVQTIKIQEVENKNRELEKRLSEMEELIHG